MLQGKAFGIEGKLISRIEIRFDGEDGGTDDLLVVPVEREVKTGMDEVVGSFGGSLIGSSDLGFEGYLREVFDFFLRIRRND